MRYAALFLACLPLSACQVSGPSEPALKVVAADPPAAPVAVAVAATFDTSVPRTNQWGGEVPDALPSTDIGEGGLAPPRKP